MLKIKNLSAIINDNKVLDDINLEVNSGELHAILGPKNAGKSSLVHTILGNPILDIEKGSILFKNRSILKKTADQRSLSGIFVSFQYLPIFDGISNFEFAKETLKAHKDRRNVNELEKEYKLLVKKLELSSNHGSKWINDETVTNTECRKNEVLQMLLLNPTLVILDSIDHDVESNELEFLANIIREFVDKNKAAIVVTHNVDFVKMLKPTHVNIIVDGSFKLQGSNKILKRIVNDDYSQFS